MVATLQVFYRDTQHLYGIVTTIWMYCTPILYPIEVIPIGLQPLFKANPMYIFIDFMRQITLSGVVPSLESFMFCALWALGMFVIGALYL